MARPKKTGLDYFSHDVDASNDEKVEAMEALYGANGYTFYFKMLERVYRNGGELDVSDAETRQILARKCLLSLEDWERMLQSSFKIKLFDRDIYESSWIITSEGIKKRREFITNKREKSAIRYQNQVSVTETTPESTQSKVNKTKEKESKLKELKISFEEFRKKYSGTKKGLDPEWNNFFKKYESQAEIIIPLLLPAIEKEKLHKDEQKLKSGWSPEWKNLSTWINQQCWTQEFSEITANGNSFQKQETFTPQIPVVF